MQCTLRTLHGHLKGDKKGDPMVTTHSLVCGRGESTSNDDEAGVVVSGQPVSCSKLLRAGQEDPPGYHQV